MYLSERLEAKFEQFQDGDYNSGLGRFISEDPIGFMSGEANLRRYAANSPIMLMDPTGYFCQQRFLSRIGQNFRLTTSATSIVSNSAAFAVALIN